MARPATQFAEILELDARAYSRYNLGGAERCALRARADAAFAVVQRLNQLRRRVYALLTGNRDSAEESKHTATALRAASQLTIRA